MNFSNNKQTQASVLIINNTWLTIENIEGEVVLEDCFHDANGEIIIPDGMTKIRGELEHSGGAIV